MADYNDGYFHHYFVRYLARNKDSSLSGSLPSNVYRCFPRAIPSLSSHHRTSSFPNPSAGSFAGNLQSFLVNNEEGSVVRRVPVDGPGWTRMNRQGRQKRQEAESESSPEEG